MHNPFDLVNQLINVNHFHMAKKWPSKVDIDRKGFVSVFCWFY